MSIRSNVDARALDQRVAFERRTTTQTGTGGETVAWVRLGPAPDSRYWARVDGAKAGEPYIADGIRTESSCTFWIRADVPARLGLVKTDRIVWRGVPYDILDMPDQQLRGRLQAVIARAGLNEG